MVNFVKGFILLLIINLAHGLFDGMISCAYGKYDQVQKRSIFSSSKRQIRHDDVRFFLFNKKHLNNPVEIFLNNKVRLVNENFNSTRLTKIFIHGYKSSIKRSSSRLIKNAFLESGDFNVLIVDWSRAQHWGYSYKILTLYPTVLKYLTDVAKDVISMINLLENYGLDLNTTTIIGHSLGAHIAGMVGRHFKDRVNHIVGLDPAAPKMSDKKDLWLSKDSARHVEVIHTEIDHCGLNAQLGHYDFYPNSGRSQPGCDSYKCSHARSYRYYAESIVTKAGFYGRRCENWQSMQSGNCKGELVRMGGVTRSPMKPGIYYLKTNPESPFAMGRS